MVLVTGNKHVNIFGAEELSVLNRVTHMYRTRGSSMDQPTGP